MLMLERIFHLKEHDTTVRREVIGGLTSFLTMAYILAVNPNILGTVMYRSGVFAATAPALIYVGMLMISSAKKIDFEGDIADVAGAYMAMLLMPLAYSIATGIMFAILIWVILKVVEKKARDVSPGHVGRFCPFRPQDRHSGDQFPIAQCPDTRKSRYIKKFRLFQYLNVFYCVQLLVNQ